MASASRRGRSYPPSAHRKQAQYLTAARGCRLVRTLVGVPFLASPLFLFLPLETPLLFGRLVGEMAPLLGLVVLTEPLLLGGFVCRGCDLTRSGCHVSRIPRPQFCPSVTR